MWLVSDASGAHHFPHSSISEGLFGQKAYIEIYPSGIEYVYRTIFSRSLHVMSEKLKRDMYDLDPIRVPINQVKQQRYDRLSPTRYSCVHWINHLLGCYPVKNATNDLQDGGPIDNFMRLSYLYWLEALSLCRSMPEGWCQWRNSRLYFRYSFRSLVPL